jgi:hypothetical protein
MLETQKPSYVAVAFDLKAPTFRHKMYSDYKGTRKPMPEELRPQIPLLKEVLKLIKITLISNPSIFHTIIGLLCPHIKHHTKRCICFIFFLFLVVK